MNSGAPSETASVAVIVPVRDEAECISEVIDGILVAADSFPLEEVIVVDDGSTDATPQILSARAAAEPRLRVLTHLRSGGQSGAIQTAVLAARAPVIAMLDGDGQNPPEELPRLVAPLLSAPGRLGLVAGQRVLRQDTVWKRLGSRMANGLRGALLSDGTRDTGCGLKAFRRDAYLMLPYFDHMHRYLPALFQRDGWDVVHVDVSHRPRIGGRSKYTNLQRALVGAVDLIGVAWLIRRRKIERTPADILTGEG